MQSTNSNILNNNSDETYQKYLTNPLLSHQKLIAVEQASSSEQISTNYFPNQSPKRLLVEQDSNQLLQDSEIKFLSREYQVNQQYQYQALRRSRSQTHSNNQISPSNDSQTQQKTQTILTETKLNKQNEEILIKLSELQTDNEILRKRQQQLQNSIAEKEFNLCRYKVLSEELDAQTNINKDALQKASVLIKTMSEDLQDKNQQLEELQDKLSKNQVDLLNSRQQIFALETQYKQKVQQLETNLQHAESDDITKNLKSKIDEINRTHKKELDELLDQKKLLEQELRLARKMKDDIEKNLQQKNEQLTIELKGRAIDKLTAEDQLLNMKIDMAALQKQFENDLDIKEEFVVHMQKIYEGKLQQFMNQEKVGEFVTPQKSYAHILWDEFKKTQIELSNIMQIVVRNKIKLDLERFEQFRKQVLEVFGDWMEKSKQLANVSKRHGDVVEQYKLMTVRLKSLIKEKDMLVTNLSYQNKELKNQLYTFINQFSNQSSEDKEYILSQFKASSKLLSMHLQAKFIECEQTIEQHTIFEQDQILKDQEIQRLNQEIARYQDELKFSRQENKVIQQKLQNLMQDVALAIENEQIENFNLENRKERLSMTQPQHPRRDYNCLRARSMSPTQHMTNQPAIIVLSEGALINKVKRLVIERENYKKTTESERKQIEDQLKEIGNLKADLALKEGQTSERIKQLEQDFEKQQLELQQTYKQYSEMTQQKINHLEEMLQNEKQQSQMMDRQLQRSEEKALESETREKELIQKITELQAEKEKAEYRTNQIQIAFDVQSNKFRVLQDRTDQKVIELDEIQKQLEFLNRVRQTQEGQLQQQSDREQELISQFNEIQDKLKRSYLEHDKLEDKIQSLLNQLDQLNCEYQSQIKKNSESVQQILNLEKSLNQAEMKNQELLDECRIQNIEIKRYQDSLTFLSREADELKLMALDAKIFEQQLLDAREQLDESSAQIKQLKAVRDKKLVSNSVEVQTASDYEHENFKLQEQIADCEEEIYKLEGERNLLQEAVQRAFDDLNRVINSKRELESQILQIRQTQCQCNKPLDLNPVRPNSPQVNLTMQQNILKENEQYIQKLEYELNQLRDENQHLKEKIINYEVNNICTAYDGISPTKHQRMVPHQLPQHSQRKQQGVQFSNQQVVTSNQKISRNNSRYHESTKDQTAETNFYSREAQALRNNSYTQAEFKKISINNLIPKGQNESLRFQPAESDQVNLSKLHGSTYMSGGQMLRTGALYQYYSDNRKDGTQQSFDGQGVLSPQTNVNLFRTDTVHEHWKQN